MQEHKEKEMEKRDNKKKKISGEKKFYMTTAIGCAVALAVIVILAVVISGKDTPVVENQANNQIIPEESLPSDREEKEDEQVSTQPEGMIVPVVSSSVSQEHGFHHNTTLNSYYEHTGMDFAAEVGAKVLAVDDGVVESVYKDDLLVGTQITIDHGNGLKSVYCFVTETDGLKAGVKVKKGDVIATVAEPCGKEYKQGAHLHFEIVKNDVSVDPSGYLTLEEK